MTHQINATHDPDRRSWVQSANAPDADFPVQNLPFGVFRRGPGRAPCVGVAIGDRVLDIAAARDAGFLSEAPMAVDACRSGSLNALMALPPVEWSRLRWALSELLSIGGKEAVRAERDRDLILCDAAQVEMLLPAEIGDYTDFYASVHHATNVGSMFRPDNPLLPNYKYVPIGYHGRASSIVPSGTAVRRPNGQRKAPTDAAPTFGPSRQLDYECEVGVFVGGANSLGTSVPLAEAERRMFGLCLVNDWSARDLQSWEYQPLGPFLAKNFATTISPWVVTLEALAPFRSAAYRRPAGDPAPLPYLASPENEASGGFDITLEVSLRTARMRDAGLPPARLSRGGFEGMYWTLAQMLTHHASNGCNLQPGDLFASGTVSGTTKDSRGCLLELTWRGTEPVSLPDGETRAFLQDGDELAMRGWCEREGAVRIGFGECEGRVVSSE